MMKIGGAMAWALNRTIKLYGNILSLVARCFVKVKRSRVVCWAYNYKQYGCNPRYISEYLLEHHPDMEIVWVFRRGVDTSAVDSRIRCVRFRTWEYLKTMASAEFLVTNSRTDPWHVYWHKRPEQKYLMLWHGGAALKRVERDVEDRLGFSYVQKAKRDSKVCDLMISGCRANTELIKRSFWYEGEILEMGIPRNDIFFNKGLHNRLRKSIVEQYNLPDDGRIVLYAPTFRRSGTIEPYSIDWDRVIPCLERMFGAKVSLLMRLHPNLIGKVDTSSLTSNPAVVDVTCYPDMQELLCVSDMLITDYSSSMFDYAMLRRPCLLYATDVEQYDRGYYYDFRELPFPLSRDVDALVATIEDFDIESYKLSLERFLDERLGLIERGVAAESLARWMVAKQIK
ncbi:MAG: hypothetical protein E7135_05300 [Rikenellaceae bacterium]|nr:hypothetical protein [Rikenellaceae bacterium]